jgi:hypothetical protein
MKNTLELHKRWKADPSKGEVFTPVELVNEMLDKIPTSVWENPTTTFLDPCMGKGTFLVEIVNRLVYIYGYSEEDAISRVYGYDVRIKYINFNKRGGLVNIFYKDFLIEEFNMKFDVVIGNPPYQLKVGDKKTEPLWNKFFYKSITVLTEGGYLSFIHPSGWRDIEGKFKDIQDVMKTKKINYLSLHDEKDSQKIFGVQSCFDWYVLQNSQPENGFTTTIKCTDNTIISEDLTKMNFIPNGNFGEIKLLLAGDKDEKVNLIFSYSDYETRKKHMSKIPTEEYQYPCVSNVNKDGSLTLYYSNTIEKGHFGVPKLICGKASSGTNFYIDNTGEYGVTQYGFAIVDEPEILEKIKMALSSDKFKKLSQSLPRFSQAVNHKVVAKFRKDFWKEFINE